MASQQQKQTNNPERKSLPSPTHPNQGLSLASSPAYRLPNGRPVASNQTVEDSDQLMGYLD
ncbi:MAG: hypothetical protein F6K32_16095 [Desertifilum sp. SIO1I2]|nr:hypothetical protein [Desertifilum sp. SIO1I2]